MDPQPILKGMAKGQTMQQFIESWKNVDIDFDKRCDELVGRVVSFLQLHTPFKVSQFVKGGSIGKSTFISSKSDIDIIFFPNEVKSVQDLEANVESILYTLRHTMESKWQSFAGTITFKRQTKHGICFVLSCGEPINQEHDVDLLPAYDVLANYRTSAEVFNHMKQQTERQRDFYSVCFARKQVEFVKLAPIKLKSLIRLFKFWAKHEVNVETKAISSYCIEVIIMYRWQQWGSPDNFNTNDKFYEVMQVLANLNSLRIIWEDRYNATSYRTLPPAPVILDPANPFINLAPLPKHQSMVATRAREVVARIEALQRYHGQRR